ncbi:MAG: SAM-dependent methyltransferase [Myxococcales bacterium]
MIQAVQPTPTPEPHPEPGEVRAPREPAMHRPGKLRNSLALLSLALPRNPAAGVENLYELITDMFDVVAEGSAIINFGYGDPGTRPSELRRAQEELCHQTARRLPRRGEWLDVGCGIGGPACLLALENPSVRISGLNITRGQIAIAKERATARGLDGRVEFHHGDACDMPFAGSGRFSGLYAIETAFHFADKAAFAREAARVLEPGGRFACADIVLRDDMRLRDRLLHLSSRRVLASPDLYTVSRWRRSLDEARFRDVEVRDISREVFGLMGAWADKVEEKRRALNDRYPDTLLDAILWGLRYLHRQANDPPLRYVLIEATRR